jgi:thymidylate synthase (FAD)
MEELMEVFIVGESGYDAEGVEEYLKYIGAEGWSSETEIDGQFLIELAGRGCYQSFGTKLNLNITKVREGQEAYIRNLLASGHGSVLEHVLVNFRLCDVSRVFTAELNRHRVGVAISEESLRYVRSDHFAYNIPSCVANHPRGLEKYEKIMRYIDREKGELDEIMGLNDDIPFRLKKTISSATRRVLPMGMLVDTGWSANIRTIRHCLVLRTNEHAEEEIRQVFDKIALLCTERYPYLFQDMKRTVKDHIGEWEITGSR